MRDLDERGRVQDRVHNHRRGQELGGERRGWLWLSGSEWCRSCYLAVGMWPADNPKPPSAITVRRDIASAFMNAMFVRYGTALRLVERRNSVSSRPFYLSMHLHLPLPDG